MDYVPSLLMVELNYSHCLIRDSYQAIKLFREGTKFISLEHSNYQQRARLQHATQHGNVCHTALARKHNNAFIPGI